MVKCEMIVRWGFGLDGEAALKLLILAELTLKESKMLLGFLPAIL